MFASQLILPWHTGGDGEDGMCLVRMVMTDIHGIDFLDIRRDAHIVFKALHRFFVSSVDMESDQPS